MLRNKMSGFTLIELMVVIVIIGVLASLAIPRFTEASAKAKISEAPRVLASFESAYLAAATEMSAEQLKTMGANDLVFEKPTDSKWFNYAIGKSGTGEYGVDACQGEAKSKMGSFTTDDWLQTQYSETSDKFTHYSSSVDVAKKMVPNFDAKDGGTSLTAAADDDPPCTGDEC